jgi:hypothetical protein
MRDWEVDRRVKIPSSAGQIRHSSFEFDRPAYLQPPKSVRSVLTKKSPNATYRRDYSVSGANAGGRGVDILDAAQKTITSRHQELSSRLSLSDQSRGLNYTEPTQRANTMTTSTVQYVERSTFSTSSRGSTPSPPADKSHFIRRLFTRGSGGSEKLLLPHSPPPAYNEFEFRGQDQTFMGGLAMQPSPHTRPLQNKPVARQETFQSNVRPKLKVRSQEPAAVSDGRQSRDGQVANARRIAESYGDGQKRPRTSQTSPGSLIDGGDPAEAYTMSLRERESAAMSAAVEQKYVQEWGFFIKCYSEVRCSHTRS